MQYKLAKHVYLFSERQSTISGLIVNSSTQKDFGTN